MTYDMVVDIFRKNKERIFQNYPNVALSYINKISNIDSIKLKNELLFLFINYLKTGKDNLIMELKNIIFTDKYDSYLASEQFRRTYYRSLKAIFDIIENKSVFKYDNEYHKLKNKFLDLRNNLTSLLLKNSIKKEKVNETELNNYILKLQNNNTDLHAHLNYYLDKKNVFLPNDINLINNKNVKIWADSELTINGMLFQAENVRKEVEINRNFNMWFSSNQEEQHWLIIDLSQITSIKKVVIEHHYILKHITNHYEIYGSNDCVQWNLIKNIEENRDVVNVFDFNTPLAYRYLKIFIIKSNEYGDSIAIINKIYIF